MFQSAMVAARVNGLMLLWILRSLLSLVLGLLVFGAFLAHMAFGVLDGLFDDRTYADALAEQDAYRRLYSEVLLDPSLESFFREWFEQVPAVSHSEQVELLKQVAPPAYLQEQVEGNLARGSAYFGGETDWLELYVDLEEPLTGLESVVTGYLDRRIAELEVLEPASLDVLSDLESYVQDSTESLRVAVLERRAPDKIPSLRAIPAHLRGDIFDEVMSGAPDYLSPDQLGRLNLEEVQPQLRAQFVAGDTQGFLKLAARQAAIPLVDNNVARLREGLEEGSRLNLLALAAEEGGILTETELREEIEDFRDDVRRGRFWSLIVVIFGTVAMGLLYLPNRVGCLRWPGLTLLLTGGAAFLLGRLVEAMLPRLVVGQVSRLPELGLDLSPAAVSLASDVLKSALEGLLDGLGNPGLLLALVGAALYAAPFGWARWRKLRGQSSAPEASSGPGAA